jgi:hypothetical protein
MAFLMLEARAVALHLVVASIDLRRPTGQPA